MKTAGIVLAAGASRRFGTPKQLHLVHGEPMLGRAVRVCSEAELSPVIVVLGAHADKIEHLPELKRAAVVRNPLWQNGMASSIQVGLTALSPFAVDAAVITTCDMPFVSPDHLRTLVALAAATGTNVGSAGNGWAGVPACFLRQSFPDLLKLNGEAGARTLLKDAPTVPLSNGLDVDTPDDLSPLS